MRWFALYLPQFHEIEENNHWWGKGFTEWTHVNGAKPLYIGHRQPVVPLNQNYYNLLNKSVVEWQTELMKKYGLNGFVYYHYYFAGKKIMEKPAENLLKWKDIDQPFFFCWANHSWFQAHENHKKLLIEQTYGKQQDWEKHFEYLLPFFKDARYEKRDNKPLFMIFNSNFKEKGDMLDFFNKKCIENGFAGISVIETRLDNASESNLYTSPHTDLIYLREPNVSQNIWNTKSLFRRGVNRLYRSLINRKINLLPRKYKGKSLYKIMQKNYSTNPKLCHGVFFSWDNTPRHGKYGYIITPPSKELFMKYADKIQNDEYVFINAWNEWAEGMILEPTEHNKYKYLEWIKEWNESRANNTF